MRGAFTMLHRRGRLRNFIGTQILCSSLSPPFSLTMKTAIIAALLGSAAAFAPSQQSARSSSSLAADFSSEIGVQEPLGYWCVTPVQLVDLFVSWASVQSEF